MQTKLQVVREKLLNAKHVKWVCKGLWEPCTEELRGLNVSHWDVSNFTTVRTCHCTTWPDPSTTAHDAGNMSHSRLHQRNNGTGNQYSGVVKLFSYHELQDLKWFFSFLTRAITLPKGFWHCMGKGVRAFLTSTARRDRRTCADPGMGGTREMHNPPGNKLVNWLQRWKKILSIFMQGKSFQREKTAVTKYTCTHCYMWLEIRASVLRKSQK